MPEPSDPAALDLKYHTLALCLLIEFFVWDLIGPEDATFDFAEIFTSRSWIVKEKILQIGCVIAFTRKGYYRYKVNFLKQFFWKACLQREFVIQDFLFTQTGKIPRKGHLNDLSNEYKIISVSKRIFSKKRIFDERYAWMRKSSLVS